jgi:hypothetical protein
MQALSWLSDTSESESDSDESRSDDPTRLLEGDALFLHEHNLPGILAFMDESVSMSRGNSSIESLTLYAYSLSEIYDKRHILGLDEGVWERLGEVIGNLEALKTISILCDDGPENGATPNWERLACIIRHIRQSVIVDIDGFCQWGSVETLPFVQAIHGHPTIKGFDVGNGRIPYESMSMLCSTLATLPALTQVQLHAIEPDDGITLANPETLTELLCVPSLRSVKFSRFYFTRALCQATANALAKGTNIIDLDFNDCKFSDGDCAIMMTDGLSKNRSVANIRVDEAPFYGVLKCAVAAALALNSTLRLLSFEDWHPNLSPLFLALGQNTGLNCLFIEKCQSMDESLCTAMEYGLGTNETLRELELHDISLRDDNFALWCRCFSFLRSKALKALSVFVYHGVTESCASAFRMHIAAMLQENVSLENLSIVTPGASKVEEFVALLPAFENNTTLTALCLSEEYQSLRLTDSEDKQIATLLKKSYGLKLLPDICEGGDVGTILRLNGAGRRYLIQDGSSISKGVDVLSRVNDEINCVFLHLLENPRLCDRSVVEMVNASEAESRPTSPTAGSGEGKREQANAQHEGKEARRRLA